MESGGLPRRSTYEHPGDVLPQRLLEFVKDAAASGQPLPSEPVLAEMLSVSRPALREELARLERSGFIRRRRGAGTIANPAAFELKSRFDEQTDFTTVLADAGYAASVELIEHDQVVLHATDAAELHTDAGTAAVRSVKRWRADGRPVMLAIDVVALPDPAAVVPDVATNGLFDLVAAIRGEPVEWELAQPGAANASAPVARSLEIAPRTALLTLDLVGICRSGARAYHATEYHLPGVVSAGFVRSVRQGTRRRPD